MASLEPLKKELVGIQEKLTQLTVKEVVVPEEITPLQDALRKVESHRTEGIFRMEKPSSSTSVFENIPSEQAILHGLLHNCYSMVHRLYYNMEQSDESENYNEYFNEIFNVKNGLEEMKNKNRYGQAKEIDKFQEKLRNIENNFFSKNKDDQMNVFMRKLLEYCYNLAHELYDPQNSAVDSSLDVIELELQDAYKCLCELRKKEVVTSKDLEFYRNLLRNIENHRKDGIFVTEKSMNPYPRGQARLHSLLHKCYRNLHLLDCYCEVAPELISISTELEELKAKLDSLKYRQDSNIEEELKKIQNSLHNIEKKKEGGIFKGTDEKEKKEQKVPFGQAYLSTLLEECYKLVREIYIEKIKT